MLIVYVQILESSGVDVIRATFLRCLPPYLTNIIPNDSFSLKVILSLPVAIPC